MTQVHWCPVLTLHVPPDLEAEALAKVVERAYRPLVRLLLRRPALRGGLAVEAGVSERLWREDHEEIVIALRTLMERGQLEPLDTAAYGAPLPLLPDAEAARQLARNREINRTYFGLAYQPAGVIARAYAASPALAALAHRSGHRFLICDARAFHVPDRTARLCSPSGLQFLPAQRELADALCERTAARVASSIAAFEAAGDGVVCVLPLEHLGEDPARLRRLVAASERVPLRWRTPGEQLRALARSHRRAVDCEPDGVPWLLWRDPGQSVHRMQWRSIAHARAMVERDPDGHPRARELLDRALCADYLAAAAAPPFFNRARIEHGARMLLESVLAAASDEEEQAEARFYAFEIGERARACEESFSETTNAAAAARPHRPTAARVPL